MKIKAACQSPDLPGAIAFAQGIYGTLKGSRRPLLKNIPYYGASDTLLCRFLLPTSAELDTVQIIPILAVQTITYIVDDWDPPGNSGQPIRLASAGPDNTQSGDVLGMTGTVVTLTGPAKQPFSITSYDLLICSVEEVEPPTWQWCLDTAYAHGNGGVVNATTFPESDTLVQKFVFTVGGYGAVRFHIHADASGIYSAFDIDTGYCYFPYYRYLIGDAEGSISCGGEADVSSWREVIPTEVDGYVAGGEATVLQYLPMYWTAQCDAVAGGYASYTIDSKRYIQGLGGPVAGGGAAVTGYLPVYVTTSGGVVISAAATVSRAVSRSVAASGGIPCTGSASAVRHLPGYVTSSGGAAVSGGATVLFNATRYIKGAGGPAAAGSASVSAYLPRRLTTAGGCVAAGAASVARTFTFSYVSAGGPVAGGGASSVQHLPQYVTSSGGIIASGNAVVTMDADRYVAGAVMSVSGGSATVSRTVSSSRVSSGGGVVSGTLSLSITRRVSPAVTQVPVSGSGTVVRKRSVTSAGGTIAKGVASIARQLHPATSVCNAVSSGTASLIHKRRLTASGGVVASGNASFIPSITYVTSGGAVSSGAATLIINDLKITSTYGNTVLWEGGTSPFTVVVQAYGGAGSFYNVDTTAHMAWFRSFTVTSSDGVTPEIWWAADDVLDGSGNATQRYVGVLITDSSVPQKRAFASFGGVVGAYGRFGPPTWCVPTIVWGNSFLAGGMPISADQLNASIYFIPGSAGNSLPGTFAYSPPAGTYLTKGAHQVSVVFQASDAVHYHAASKTVTVTVGDRMPTISQMYLSVTDAKTGVKTDYTVSPSAGYNVNARMNDVVGFTVVASDPDGDQLTYLWHLYRNGTQLSNFIGSDLVNSYTVQSTDVGYALDWRVSASDGELSSAEWYGTITVINTVSTPTCRIIYDSGSPSIGSLIVFLNTTPPDPEGDTLVFSWAMTQRPAGSNAQLVHGIYQGIYDAMAFYIDVAGSYVVRETATDSHGLSASSYFTITSDNLIPNSCSCHLASDVYINTSTEIIIDNPGSGSGTLTFTASNGNVQITSSSGRWYIRGLVAGSCQVTMRKASDGVYMQASYAFSFIVSGSVAPMQYQITALDVVKVWGGTPYGDGYHFSLYGGTGGTWVSKYGSGNNYYYVARVTLDNHLTCYCPGAGVRFTDAAGRTLDVPFSSSFGPPVICTSGCPDTTLPGYDLVWTGHEAGDMYWSDASFIPGDNCGTMINSQHGTIRDVVDSFDGLYRVEYYYISGVTSSEAELYPGDWISVMNQQTGYNFSFGSFAFCHGGYDYYNTTYSCKFTRLWRKK